VLAGMVLAGMMLVTDVGEPDSEAGRPGDG
jgi:hypothetical protein